jgi:low temperature requirement protein LtrA
MLGEIIVATLSNLVKVVSWEVVLGSVAGLTIAFTLQWVYFDVEGSAQEQHAIRRHWTSGIVWLIAHVPLHGGILVLASGLLNLMTVLVNTAIYEDNPPDAGMSHVLVGAGGGSKYRELASCFAHAN